MILKLNKCGKFDICHASLWTKQFHQTGGIIIDSFGLFVYFFISLRTLKYIYSVIVFKHYFCLRQPRGLPLLNDLTLRPVIFSTSVLKLSSPMANPLFMLSLITLSK